VDPDGRCDRSWRAPRSCAQGAERVVELLARGWPGGWGRTRAPAGAPPRAAPAARRPAATPP